MSDERPKPSPRGRPAPPPRAGARSIGAERLERLRAGESVQRDIKAYPGSITFHDLIRKNKRSSVVLIIAMVLVGTLLGGAIGGAVGGYALAGEGWEGAWIGILPTVAIGAMIAMLLSLGGSAWAWNSGGNAILRMAHARPVRKQDDPELFNVVDEMRIAAGLPMPKIYLIGDGAMNAFATGKDPEHGVVAITKGLREKLSRDELQAVIAHEMAHIRHYDIRFSLLLATMVGLIAVVSDGFLRSLWYGSARGGRRRGGGEGGGAAQIIMVVIAVLLAVLAPIAAKLIQMAYSREREFLADAGAVELTRNPEAMASALATLATDHDPLVDTANRGMAHMFIVNPLRKARRSEGEWSSLLSSHPPIKKRIARLLALTR